METDSTTSLARALDDEFKRVARAEDISMDALVTEVASIVGCKPRQLYNYRSGRWPIPSSLLPQLCLRFKSRLLLDVLGDAMPRIEPKAIDNDDAWTMSRRVMSDTLIQAAYIQRALAGDGFTLSDLTRLGEITDSIARDLRRLYEYAEDAYERARERRQQTA